MKVIFASLNNNKLKEVKSIVNNYEVVSLKDLNDYDDVIEDGNTFHENAYKKAKYFYDKYKLPVISDDSGLVVESLGGQPGIYSARYCGENSNELNNNLKLLNNMENIRKRDAYFICVICYIDKSGIDYYFEGRVYGEITNNLSGVNGFGYDPLFYLPIYEKTMAEISDELKNQISHRAIALKKFSSFLKEE